MSKVLKQGNVSHSEDVVLIPDVEKPDYFDPEGAPEARGIHHDELYESILRDARAEADRLNEKLMGFAQKERDLLIAGARKEADEIREEARQQGYRDGAAQRVREIDACIRDVIACIGELRGEQMNYLVYYAGQLRQFAADIAGRILCQKVEEGDTALLALVRQAVHSIRDADWISVEVSNQLPGLVRQLEEDYAGRDAGECRVEISGEDLPRGACRIQTPEGVIDVSVSTQLENLVQIFREMDISGEDI